ncbi:MAG: hypothetical protein MUO64_20555 [Anaerolineales bacterium]|nr:hypothetical protein [Anaerolineales bacterium]
MNNDAHDKLVLTNTGNLKLSSTSDQTARGLSPLLSPLFTARYVRAGPVRAAGNQVSNMTISSAALSDATYKGLFDSKAVFIDHPGFFQNPSIRNLIAATCRSYYDAVDQTVNGDLVFYNTPDAKVISDLLFELLSQDNHLDIGLSLVFWADRKVEPDGAITIMNITHVESIDLVFEPAADGRVLQALSALNQTPYEMSKIKEQGVSKMSIQDNLVEINKASQEAHSLKDSQESSESETASQAADSTGPNNASDAPADPQAWAAAAANTVAQVMISSSDLPQASKERLSKVKYSSPAQVTAAIDSERSYLASLAEDKVIQMSGQAPRGGDIQFGRSGYEQLTAAFDAMLDGVRPPDGIRPLSGIRELYNLLSGDYDLTGVFHADRVQFANVTCATMAGLVANALNKRVVNEFMQYPRWWEPFTMPEDFNTLQQVKWITLAGIGELPTVAEGAAYTELAWDDKTETADFIKKGGYLGITLEAIDKDDTGRLRAAPRALAQGAYLTLAKSVSAVFTAQTGTGPNMADTYALFEDTHHHNLGSSALSATSWAATRSAMRSQLELDGGGGSPAYLGALTAPRFLLVPNELENTALQILGAVSSGSANYLDNVWAEGDSLTERMRSARARVIVVDMWTDADNWAALADPLLYPTIGIGYRYGRVPEIFSVSAPNQGLMFTNDVMPVKVRFFFAVGPMEWRGLYKHNVT